MSANERATRALREILQHPGNEACADCGAPGEMEKMSLRAVKCVSSFSSSFSGVVEKWREEGAVGGTTCANTARTPAKSILTSCYLLFFFNIKLQTNWGSRALLEGTVSRSLSLFCGGEETFSESNMSWQAGSRCTHPHLVLPASLWRSLAEMSDPLQILQ